MTISLPSAVETTAARDRPLRPWARWLIHVRSTHDDLICAAESWGLLFSFSSPRNVQISSSELVPSLLTDSVGDRSFKLALSASKQEPTTLLRNHFSLITTSFILTHGHDIIFQGQAH